MYHSSEVGRGPRTGRGPGCNQEATKTRGHNENRHMSGCMREHAHTLTDSFLGTVVTAEA